MTHRYFVVGILVLGVIALLLPGPVSGQADMLVLSGDFHQASGWGCVGMPVAGAPGIITVTADQQTSRNLVVNANSLTANPDGSIWVIPTFYSVQNSGSSRPVNYAYSGMQIAMVGDIIYVFTQNSSTQLDLNSFIITGGSSPLTANWASPKTVLFSSSGTSMSLFKVIPSSNGIYLVSRQTSGNSPVLDISWIPENQLENPGSTITPSRVCQVANSSAFLAPATQIYNVMSTTYPGTNNTLIVGISDSGGQVYSWYVNPQNPDDQAQTLLFSSSDLQNYFNSHLSTVALFKGSFETDPSGIDDLVVIAFMYDDSAWTPDTSGATFYANLTQLGTPGYRWTNAQIDYNNEMGKWYATPGLCCMYSTLAVPNGDGKLRSNMIMVDALTMTNMLGQVVTELTGGTLPSDLLVPDPGPAGTFDTLSSFDQYGNLAVPVGVIDGVPPIALNGHTLDPSDVDSKVTLIKTSTASTDTTGKTSTSVTSGYDNDFADEMISVDASYEQTITQTTTTGTEFSNTMTEDFGLDSQGGNDYAYMVYLAPQFKTQRFYVYDYHGNPPVSGSPKTIYVTYPDPATPYKYFFQGYPITTPPQTGWLDGAMKSPWYDDFDDWDQATWSGGWHNRDWTVTPDYNKKYQVQVFNEDLEFQNGASQTSTYDMTSTVKNSYETEKKISASANILGFERSGEITYEQDSSVSNAIEQGIEFYWSMSMPDGNESGYQTVVVEPQIVTPIENMGAGPWTPSTYDAYQPWLITYNLVTAEMTSGTPPGVRPHKLVTGVNPFQSGAITMTPSSPEKGDQVEFRADAGTGYSFAYWKSWGVSLDDPSSMITLGTINNDISTVRAYFVKSSSDTVSSADISIPATGPGSVTIQGKIPEGLTLPIAMNVKYPIKVSVGSEEFSFGPGVGERKVVLPQKLLFTTPDTKKGNSTLTLDYTTKTWTFSSPKAYDLGRAVLGTSSVRLGVSARNTGPVEDLPLVGTETCTWAGGIGAEDNSVFSFGPQTLVKGNFTFNGANQGLGTLEVRNAGLSHGTIDASTPVTFTVNQVKVHWDNATSTENGTYTYMKSERDLFTSLVLDTRSMTWQAEMGGKRLVHTTWPGVMTIILQVGSDSGRTTIHPSVTADLHIWKKGPLKANFMAMPTRGTAPLSVQFTDLSGGQPTAWEWKFGDGTTSVRQDPEHTYAKEGTYTVTLTVRGSTGSGTFERKNYIVVSPRPVPLVADFMVSPVSGTAPLTVKCSDMSTGSPTMYVYSFGDGTSSTDRNPGHTYRVPGIYNITLIITKPDKSTGAILSNSSTKKGITVGAVPFEMPVAQFSASSTHGTAPLSVTFTDHSTGSPTVYNYNFGDGTNTSAKNPVHIYRWPGIYNVTLTVMKNDIANVTMVANASVPLELTVTKKG